MVKNFQVIHYLWLYDVREISRIHLDWDSWLDSIYITGLS